MDYLKKILCRIFNTGMNGRIWGVAVAAISLTIVLGAALLAFTVAPHYRYRMPFFYDTVYYEIYATAPDKNAPRN